jgi:hypothetical protein
LLPLLMPDGGCSWWWLWAAVVVAEAAAVVAVQVVVFAGGGGGGGGGWWWCRRRSAGEGWARAATFCFFNPFQKSLPRAIYASRQRCGTDVPRGFGGALGTELFAGPTVPSALCRELPLGRGCAERIPACAKSKSLSAKPWIPVVCKYKWLYFEAGTKGFAVTWHEMTATLPNI